MIKVLIVNDSISTQQVLKRIVTLNSEMDVVGIANDGHEGVDMAESCDPDVVLMDIHMPNYDGVQTTKQIMEENPRSILVVTATLNANMSQIYDCLDFGAIDVVRTPTLGKNIRGLEDDDFLQEIGAELIRKINIAASITRKDRVKVKTSSNFKSETLRIHRPEESIRGTCSKKILAIGASTGGPNAILRVLKALPKDLNAGIFIVQHIDAAFASGLAEWFNENTDALNIYSAKQGDVITKSTGFVAVEDRNLIVQGNHCAGYVDCEPNTTYCPNINATFKSVAEQYGKNAVGVLLTGMGNDGAKGLKSIREAGGKTIAQDESTSLIYGMPKVAKEMDSAEFILSIDDISKKIVFLLNN